MMTEKQIEKLGTFHNKVGWLQRRREDGSLNEQFFLEYDQQEEKLKKVLEVIYGTSDF